MTHKTLSEQTITPPAVTRLPITTALLRAAWALRDNVAARDGLYVAAAMGLSVGLVTTDDRLARALPDIAVDLENDRPYPLAPVPRFRL